MHVSYNHFFLRELRQTASMFLVNILVLVEANLNSIFFVCRNFVEMENAEEILHFLEEFTKRKPKSIPQELNDYLAFVARTGDPVYQWSLVKSLFKEKLLNVITDFYETTPGLDIPPYPNVDPFNYDIMKNSLLERLDSFTAAPFTVQRICELLTYPRKQYNRIDKFMRAVEKNILVVSTREPGPQRQAELENGDPLEPLVNGSDNNSECNVDVEMEDMSWKENAELQQSREPQPSSSDAHISVDDIEVKLHEKQDTPMDDTQEKPTTQYETVTPPEPNVTEESTPEEKPAEEITIENKPMLEEEIAKPVEIPSTSESIETPNMDTETPVDPIVNTALVIPEITVDDAEMTEQKLIKQASLESTSEEKPVEHITENIAQEVIVPEVKEPFPEVKEPLPEVQQPQTLDDSSSDSNKEECNDAKLISEESTSSDEISSSSDNADGNSNSPTPDNQPKTELVNVSHVLPEKAIEVQKLQEEAKIEIEEPKPPAEITEIQKEPQMSIEEENYSITDVKSELPQPPAEPCKSPEKPIEDAKDSVTMETDGKPEETKPDIPEAEAALDKAS